APSDRLSPTCPCPRCDLLTWPPENNCSPRAITPCLSAPCELFSRQDRGPALFRSAVPADPAVEELPHVHHGSPLHRARTVGRRARTGRRPPARRFARR